MLVVDLICKIKSNKTFLTLSSLNLPLSSSSTTSRKLLSQFSTCSEWRWLGVGGKWKKILLSIKQFHEIFVLLVVWVRFSVLQGMPPISGSTVVECTKQTREFDQMLVNVSCLLGKLPNAVFHRLRRWTNVKPTLIPCLVSAGYWPGWGVKWPWALYEVYASISSSTWQLALLKHQSWI